MNKIFLFVVSLVLMPFATVSAQSALGTQMERMFDGAMVTTTSPGFYEGITSGVITGGRFRMREKIVNTPLVGLTPPSFSHGCGGIDLYAGSFSFISKDEFLTLIRSVASQAKGYLFQLAISRMCNPCEAKMAQLSKIVREINQNFSNSCQMAQGIVNDVIPGLQNKEKWKSSTFSFASDAGDVFEAFSGIGEGTPAASEQQALLSPGNTDACRNEGNVIWCLLRQKNVAENIIAVADLGSGINIIEASELLMSITGSWIAGKAEPYVQEEDGENSIEKPKTNVPGKKVSLSQLMEGGDNITIHECLGGNEATECLDVRDAPITLEGFESIVSNELYGYIDAITGNGNGLALATEPTDEQKIVLETIGGNLSQKLTRLAQADSTGELARLFTSQFTRYFALVMSYHMIENLIKVVSDPLATSNHTYAVHMRDEIDRVGELYFKEFQTISREGLGNATDVHAMYKALIADAPKFAPPRVGTQ